MLTEQQINEALQPISDPDLNKSIAETGGIRETKITGSNVSLNIALAQTGTPEQMQLQQQMVGAVKELGADSVGLRFEELTEDEIEAHGGKQEEEEAGGLLSENTKTTFIAVSSGKGGVG
ncbi:iron-sulfur cluster assembly protein, partial [Staphylococcus aureus]|uniref:iron-sulfur cluster assembly protein n=1 Tax=Staphylococcus aureus TaxID=1280 RepID=UPI00115500E1